jgi:hypothetical protein
MLQDNRKIKHCNTNSRARQVKTTQNSRHSTARNAVLPCGKGVKSFCGPEACNLVMATTQFIYSCFLDCIGYLSTMEGWFRKTIWKKSLPTLRYIPVFSWKSREKLYGNQVKLTGLWAKNQMQTSTIQSKNTSLCTTMFTVLLQTHGYYLPSRSIKQWQQNIS